MHLDSTADSMCSVCSLFVVVFSDMGFSCLCCFLFFFQAEDGIRYLVRSRGLGDVYKRQPITLIGKALGYSISERSGGISGGMLAMPAYPLRLSLIHI